MRLVARGAEVVVVGRDPGDEAEDPDDEEDDTDHEGGELHRRAVVRVVVPGGWRSGGGHAGLLGSLVLRVAVHSYPALPHRTPSRRGGCRTRGAGYGRGAPEQEDRMEPFRPGPARNPPSPPGDAWSSPAAPASSAATCARRSWTAGARWWLSTTSSPGSPANVAHLMRPTLLPAGALRRHRLRPCPRAGGPRAALRLPGITGGLPAHPDRDAQGRARWARGTPSAWPRTRAPASCSPPPRRSTATRRCTPSPSTYWGHVNPIGPRGVYDEGKRFGEALTTAYREHEGVDTGIVRIFNTYGPRMRPHDGRAIPTFIRQALRRRAAHGGRRRLADPVGLLRRRPRRAASSPSRRPVTPAR